MPISFTVLNSAAWPCINDCAPPMISVVKFPEVGLLGEKAWYVLRAPKYLYCSYCSYCSWGSQGKNTEVACHSLLQWTTLCQTSPPWPAHLGLPCRLGFIELDKAVVLVWLDWLVFCEYGFSVSALWCPLATPTILLGFLLPWTCGYRKESDTTERLNWTESTCKKNCPCVHDNRKYF